MKKRKLLGMQDLKATSNMMKIVADNPPETIKYEYGEGDKWKYRLYIRCLVSNEILKVSFFFVEHMRTGARKPAFELYISKKESEFITYDRIHDRWLTAKLDNLQWYSYISYRDKMWISEKDSKTIQKYLGGEHGGYKGLHDYQEQIGAIRLKQRHKIETDPWDMDLKRTPKLPKDWERWVSKVGITENYIYYEYTKNGATTGYCTYCEKDVPIKNPKHNKESGCPCCRHKITFKSIGKAGTVVTPTALLYLIQRCKDGFIIREFRCCRTYLKGNHKVVKCTIHEIRRVIYDKERQNPRAYHWALYKQREVRWIQNGICSPGWSYDAGKVYKKTLPDLARKELRETGLCETIARIKLIDPERYLVILKHLPLLEQITKAGLPRLTEECISNYYNIQSQIKADASNSLTKVLGINGQELKRLRQNNGDSNFLKWLQYEKAMGKDIPNEVIKWLCKEKIKEDDFKFILNRMNLVQIQNYVKRQMTENKMSSKEVVTTWSDYLSMAKRLKIDTSDEIIYRVRKLRQRHDELVARCQEKDMAIQAGEVLEKYPRVHDICESLKEKYEYMDSKYAIVSPTCIEDIIKEGKILQHCLGGSDRYWDRIERNESYILFLRKIDSMDKAYYTLEIEPNGTVRQKRTMYDRQNDDIKDATDFLIKWQKIVSKRITSKDRELAEKSQVLRNADFAHLRDNKVIISTGELRGRLLVDILMADLLENAA